MLVGQRPGANVVETERNHAPTNVVTAPQRPAKRIALIQAKSTPRQSDCGTARSRLSPDHSNESPLPLIAAQSADDKST